MSLEFKIDIISPDQSIYSNKTEEVILPCFEGQITVLKDHIPLITFLRPGCILIKNQDEKKYFVEEGTVEFSNNNLLILTSTVKDLKNFDKESINHLIQETKKKLDGNNLTDKEHYINSHKQNALREINN